MSTAPSLVWQNLLAQSVGETATVFEWRNGGLEPGDPPAVTMPVGYVLKAGVLTMGNDSTVYEISVLVDAGSDSFQLTSGTMSDLDVGMLVVPVVEAAPPNGLPNGLAIVGINQPVSGSIELGGGPSPWLSGSGDAPWIYSQPASTTLSASLNVIDEYPYGYLAATVTPSTGVTVVDWNFDGTGNPDNVGNGTAMCNSGGQACAFFGMRFADAGSYVVGIAYTSYDPAYGNASSSLTVTVT